jgi:hypothetical protein
MTVKIHILVLWIIKTRRLQDGYQSFGRNSPAFRDNFSFLLYATFHFPSMAHFYREDEGSVLSKTSVKLYILETYKDAHINKKHHNHCSQIMNILYTIHYNHYSYISFKSNLKQLTLWTYRLNRKLFNYSFWGQEMLFVL